MTPFSWAASSAWAICWASLRASASLEGASIQALLQVLSLNQLHGQKAHPIRLVQTMDHGDIGVIERRQQA